MKTLGRDLKWPTPICNQVPQTGSSFLWAGWEAEFHKTWAKWLLRHNYMVSRCGYLSSSVNLTLSTEASQRRRRTNRASVQTWHHASLYRALWSNAAIYLCKFCSPPHFILWLSPPQMVPSRIFSSLSEIPLCNLVWRIDWQGYLHEGLRLFLGKSSSPAGGGRAPFWPKDNRAGSEGKGQSECSPAPVTPTRPPAQPPRPTPGSEGEGLPLKNPVRTRGIGKLECSSKQERREGAAPLCVGGILLSGWTHRLNPLQEDINWQTRRREPWIADSRAGCTFRTAGLTAVGWRGKEQGQRSNGSPEQGAQHVWATLWGLPACWGET